MHLSGIKNKERCIKVIDILLWIEYNTEMDLILNENEIAELKKLLRDKHAKVPVRRLKSFLNIIADSNILFLVPQQRALLVKLLENWETTKKKEVIMLEELNPGSMPTTVILGVLAEDWAGMSNSILGIVHHYKRNVFYIKGFTIYYRERNLGIVILSFQVENQEEYEKFQVERKELVSEIKDASRGTSEKFRLMDDETVKMDIFNKMVKRLKDLHLASQMQKDLEENQEVMKFISARSREYLEERDIKDLTNLLVTNYQSQESIRNKEAQEIIKIKNFDTKFEELTGISFVCKEDIFSIEDFLRTLEQVVPGHIIKHHKSFVTRDGILVYRIEIVDRNAKPLDSRLIKSIETSMDKMISISCSDKFTKLKAVGGFEHYARAIIPFLQEELKRTRLTQVFINVDSKTQFLINIKLIIVSFKTARQRIYNLLSGLSLISGIDIASSIPPKVHNNQIEINILKLKVNLSEFKSIKEIYNSIKGVVKESYGNIRDFDEGFRDIYIKILNQLLEQLKNVDANLIKEIFFNIDELYKIEISPNLLLEIIRLTSESIEESRGIPGEKVLFKHKNLQDSNRTLIVISYINQKRLLSRLVQRLRDVDMYFTKIEWEHRSYVIMILSRENKVLDDQLIDELRNKVKSCSTSQ